LVFRATQTDGGRTVLRKLAAVVIVLSLIGSTGCQPPQGGTGTGSGGGKRGKIEKLRIAVIPKGTTHEFWKSVHYGADKAAKEIKAESGIDVEVIWKGPIQENDRDGQISEVQRFVTQRVDGICLAPLDSVSLIASVKEARDQNIPVVIFDSGLKDESIIVSYVATDNHRGGELAAEEMARLLDEKGSVILLRYTTGSESTEQREQGFLDKIAEYPGIEVLSSDQYLGTTPELSLEKAQQVINAYGDQIDGIFAVCEPNATGVLGALEDAQLDGKVVFIGFDPSPHMAQALVDDKMQGIVLQDPVTMGYTAVKTMVAHLRGEEVEKRINTGEYIATTDNQDDPRMQELLHPAQYGE
jgi:ribose transport system substrate-binding protein